MFSPEPSLSSLSARSPARLVQQAVTDWRVLRAVRVSQEREDRQAGSDHLESRANKDSRALPET